MRKSRKDRKDRNSRETFILAYFAELTPQSDKVLICFADSLEKEINVLVLSVSTASSA